MISFPKNPLIATGMLLIALANSTPAADPKPVSVIGIGSCARQEKPQPIWKSICEKKPDLFILMGDNIYADTHDMSVLRKDYAELGAKPGFQELLKTCPILATWDDHDYGANDAGSEYPEKDASKEAFMDFFKVPADSERRKHPGVYDSTVIGPPEKSIQVILMDTRYFRSKLKRGSSADSSTDSKDGEKKPPSTFPTTIQKKPCSGKSNGNGLNNN